MKKILLTNCIGLLCIYQATAQVATSDAYNAGSQAYDFSNSETVTADPNTGVGYVANNSGEFYHHGPATGTIIVNGLYNAFNPNNNGFVGTPGTPGVDYFQGLNGAKNTAQEIAGSVTPRFGILKLDNGTSQQINITNTNGADVGLRTDFTNGITTTVRSSNSTGALRFLNNATYTNSAIGDAQYVNGYVGKIGSQAFTFPVGNQAGTDLRTLSISAPATATTNLSIAYWRGDAGITSSTAGSAGLDPTGGNHPRSSINTTPLGGEVLKSVSPIGFWDWVPVAGTDNMTITVSKPQETGSGSYLNAAQIRLVGWNIANAQWELLGNTAASSLAEGATLSGTTNAYAGRTMASYSAIGWGSIIDIPLPVMLVSFDAKKQNNTASFISWRTASEANTTHFEVQRSTDGRNFSTLGKVAAAGTTSVAHDYTFTDATPLPGANYYRLRIVDFNGSDSYSKIAVLNYGKDVAIVMYPNPASSTVTLTGTDAGMAARIITMEGKVLSSSAITGSSVVIGLDQLAAGQYFIQVRSAAGAVISTQKLNKL